MATDTFQIGKTIRAIDRQIDRSQMRNDIIALGAGDGDNQLKSRAFHATTIRAQLSVRLAADATRISVDDASDFPAEGTIYAGMERIHYSARTNSSLDGLTRQYTADGFESLAPYDHEAGLEVYLHADTSGGIIVFYTPETPQDGSSIQVHGWAQEPMPDRAIVDQDTLDRFASRLLGAYKNPRESIALTVGEQVVTCDVGDTVDLLDALGLPLWNSPYRVYAIEFERDAVQWKLELGGPRDAAEAELVRMREDMRISRAYGQGAPNIYVTQAAENVKGGSKGLILDLTIPSDVSAINRIRIERLRLRSFEDYAFGSSNVQTTQSSTAFHVHPFDRADHRHTSGSLDAVFFTSFSGAPSHRHSWNMVNNAHGSYPLAQAVEEFTGSGGTEEHTHGVGFAKHSHGKLGKVGASGQTSVNDAGQLLLTPKSDILDGSWQGNEPLIPGLLWVHLLAGDKEYIHTALNGDRCEVKLGGRSDPNRADGHQMLIRAYFAGGGFGSFAQVLVELKEGTNVRASWVQTLSPFFFQTYARNLTEAEANSIGDYNNLSVSFTASMSGTPLPRILISQFHLLTPGHIHRLVGFPEALEHEHEPCGETAPASVTSGSAAGGGPHGHLIDAPAHVHPGIASGAVRGITMEPGEDGHTHLLDILDHVHNAQSTDEPSVNSDIVDDLAHVHGVTHHHDADVHETTYTQPSVRLYVDGNDVTAFAKPAGPYSVDTTGIDLTGVIDWTHGVHTIEFREDVADKLGRIHASVLVDVYLKARAGVVVGEFQAGATAPADQPPPGEEEPGPGPTPIVDTALLMEAETPDPSEPGQTVNFSAVLTRIDTGAGVLGKTVVFQGSDDGGTTWWAAGSGVTDSNGRATGSAIFTFEGTNQRLRASFAGDAEYSSSASNVQNHVTQQGFVFTAFGDSGFGTTFQTQLDKVKALNPNFHICLGDMSYSATPANIDTYCNRVKNTLGVNYPYMLTAGNHENGSDGFITDFTSRLPPKLTIDPEATANIPGLYGVRYYFDYPQASPYCRIILLTPGESAFGFPGTFVNGSAEYNWVSSKIDDARARGYKWVIVCYHRNYISVGEKGNEIGTSLMELLFRKKVDLILQGHDHIYGRTKSLDGPGAIGSLVIKENGPAYTKGQGVVIGINGTGGAGLDSINTGDSDINYFAAYMGSNLSLPPGGQSSRGSTRVSVTPTRISVTHEPAIGSYTDAFTIQ